MKRYFITGTDTDCGKTYVTTQLLQLFPNAIAIKPVASGCEFIENQWVNSDAYQIKRLCPLTIEAINPWQFALPIAPHIAAEREGKFLSINALAQYCLNLTHTGSDMLFIEGAGGLMVPLTEQETWVEFLVQTEIQVILVVGLKLGCINHALLTQEVLRNNNIPCAGWIANCIQPEFLALEENITSLKDRLNIPLLASIPYLGRLKDCILGA